MLTIYNTESGAKELCQFISREKVTPIFDIDGVIADASHRISLNPDGSLDLEHYRSNTTAEQVAKDKTLPIYGAVNFCNVSGIGYSIATARVLCKHSFNWLFNKRINPFIAWCRDGESDKRKDYVLKTDHFKADIPEYLRSNYCLIDDNLDNCIAAKEMGLKAVHVIADVKA
jgi:hypothetical protein